MKEGYVEKLEGELSEMEAKVAKLKHKGAGGVVESLRAKREQLTHKLEELKSSSHDRWDVVKMGVDSAWNELKAAFETAMSMGDEKQGAERGDKKDKNAA